MVCSGWDAWRLRGKPRLISQPPVQQKVLQPDQRRPAGCKNRGLSDSVQAVQNPEQLIKAPFSSRLRLDLGGGGLADRAAAGLCFKQYRLPSVAPELREAALPHLDLHQGWASGYRSQRRQFPVLTLDWSADQGSCVERLSRAGVSCSSCGVWCV